MKAKTKKEQIKSEGSMLVESFAEFAKNKNIDRPTTIHIIEDVFRTIIRKKYETDDNFDIIINPDKGDLEIWRIREIVDDNSEDIWDHDKISLSDAQKIESDFEVGEELAEEVRLEDFGRRSVLIAKQALIQKIKDYDKELVIARYKDLIDEIITAEVKLVNKVEALLVDGQGAELVLPRNHQIKGERYFKGDTIKVLVTDAQIVNGKALIKASRTDNMFLHRLLELEIPEVMDGLIVIKGVAREAGEKAKILVESYDDRIDAVGCIVGSKGSRINLIVKQLNNEFIDVINYTDNKDLLIQRALSPAKVSSVKTDKNKTIVYMAPDQVSLAIGKKGLNIKLASKLVGTNIEIFREDIQLDADDVDLIEFSDEIETWIIEEFRKIGLDSAKQVLSSDIDYLIKRTDLEEETILDVIDILKEEFE